MAEMRVARIFVNETCNQACAYCDVRRPGDRATVAGADGIRRRIDDAIDAGCREIVITGGEPTLRPDLARIAAYARSRGVSLVSIETNAVAIDGVLAASLASAGIGRARVHLPAWGAEADRVTGEPGGFERAVAGMAALTGAGVGIDLAVPILADNADVVAEVPDAVADAGLSVGAIVIVTPVSSPRPGSILSLPRLARIAADVAERCRRRGITARLDPACFVPPCVFERPDRIAHLYSMTSGGASRPGYSRRAECSACVVSDRCPGMPAALGGAAVAPIRSDRSRRRLSIISTVDEQVERELVTREIDRRSDGTAVAAHTVRINFHCNQACEFCFVSTHLPAAPDAAIRAAIVEIARAGGVLALSGGEPTLNPKLVDYVELGRREGALAIELQTNAVRLADGDLAARLVDAGVTDALVSLHGATAAVSDAITEAPGTFDRTLLGIDALAATRCRVRLNFVFCQANASQFPDVVSMAARRWPGISQTVSFVAPSTDLVPQTPELIPRYSDILPHLTAGLERAQAAGIAITGLESMCGIPLCLVPGDIAPFAALSEIAPGTDRGEFLKTETCAACSLRTRCFGIRRGYAELHGTGELRAL
jgi:MoaA/NifB/PqqE/SkfB family radical SAM enzyme